MDNSFCPNYKVCKLVSESGFTDNESQREDYIKEYCQADQLKWDSCKRLIVKNAINFCPDFVLPDTSLTIDEIIDKFDEENLN